MSSKKQTCFQLLKEGHSYDEIKSKLNVGKSTISSWFTQLPCKEKDKIKTFRIKNWRKSVNDYLIERRRQKLAEEEKIQELAAGKVGFLSKRELFLIGVSLYWAEGSKTNRWQLQFSNSDPKMVDLMMCFFRQICGVREEKFYLQMILHKNIDEETALRYWSKITKISRGQFKKACYSISRSSKQKRNRNNLPFGTLQIRILEKNITHRVYGYMKGLQLAGIV